MAAQRRTITVKAAERPPSIVGRVSGGARDGVPSRATLTLRDLEGTVVDRGTADSTGQYSLTPPRPGTYVLSCSAGGHRPQATLVAVGNRTVRHDITLDPA